MGTDTLANMVIFPLISFYLPFLFLFGWNIVMYCKVKKRFDQMEMGVFWTFKLFMYPTALIIFLVPALLDRVFSLTGDEATTIIHYIHVGSL